MSMSEGLWAPSSAPTKKIYNFSTSSQYSLLLKKARLNREESPKSLPNLTTKYSYREAKQPMKIQSIKNTQQGELKLSEESSVEQRKAWCVAQRGHLLVLLNPLPVNFLDLFTQLQGSKQ